MNTSKTHIYSWSPAAWVRRLASAPNSSNVVNFPFAITVFIILGAGLLILSCGIIATNVWLSLLGFCVSGTGKALYAWSLTE
jgi:hypothetical protein